MVARAGGRHLFAELRRRLAKRKDVRSPAALAAWIKREVHGNPAEVAQFAKAFAADVYGPNPLLAIAGNPRKSTVARTHGKAASGASRSAGGASTGGATTETGGADSRGAVTITVTNTGKAPGAIGARGVGAHAGRPARGTVRIAGANPGGRLIGTQVDEVKYQHVSEGPRVHTFTEKGTKMEGLPDGSVRIFNSRLPVWEEEGS